MRLYNFISFFASSVFLNSFSLVSTFTIILSLPSTQCQLYLNLFLTSMNQHASNDEPIRTWTRIIRRKFILLSMKTRAGTGLDHSTALISLSGVRYSFINQIRSTNWLNTTVSMVILFIIILLFVRRHNFYSPTNTKHIH